MSIDWEEIEEIQELQSGAFGKVFKAEYLGTEVAIKEFIKVEDFDSQKYEDRERAILQECRHPNVVQFMGVTTHNEKLHVVTEFINGGNLKECKVPLTFIISDQKG